MSHTSPDTDSMHALTKAEAAVPHPLEAGGNLQEYSDLLDRRFSQTKQIRFDAGNRLEQKHRVSNLAIAVLSIYVITITLLEVLVSVKTPTMQLLFPLATIIAPIFVILLTEHESSKNYLVRADTMRRCATQIGALHSELEHQRHTGAISPAGLEKIRCAYEIVLRDSTSSHDDVDYYYFQARHLHRFLSHAKGHSHSKTRLWLRGEVGYYVNVFAMPTLVMVVPGVLVVIAIISLAQVRPLSTRAQAASDPALEVATGSVLSPTPNTPHR